MITTEKFLELRNLPSVKPQDQSKYKHAKMLPYWIGGKHVCCRDDKLQKLIKYSFKCENLDAYGIGSGVGVSQAQRTNHWTR